MLFIFGFVKLVIGLIWLLITIGVLVNIWKEEGRDTGNKVLWTLGILFFPLLGPLAFILLEGRKAGV